MMSPLLLSLAMLLSAATGSISADSTAARTEGLAGTFAEPPTELATIMAAEPSRLDRSQTGDLAVEVEAIGFFKDNEYSGTQVNGYSLPGFWLRPRLTYQPIDAVRLELGVHALVFDGANKYPCYAYHDIGRWKGNQYQRGAHALPFFRVTAQWRLTTFVLGNLYGGAAHGLLEPLFSPEVNLTQDPEMGFQLLHRRRRYSLDAWLNWQSYIFEEDTHQEAFTVGVAQRILLNAPTSRLHWYLPIDVVVQHRGGEQDLPELGLGVQTLCNGAVGVGLRWTPASRLVRYVEGEAAALGAWQQSGDLWPFDIGGAATVGGSVSFRGGFRAFARVVYARDFVPLYGSPFFATLSQREDGGRYSSMLTPHLGLEWSHAFTPAYVLGLKADAYLAAAGRQTLSDGTRRAAAFSNNFSFGVYLRVRPRIRIIKVK